MTQSETFRGLLVPLFGRGLETRLTGFAEMNAVLKHEADAVHAPCQWAVAGREPFVVPDARSDPIIKRNPRDIRVRRDVVLRNPDLRAQLGYRDAVRDRL